MWQTRLRWQVKGRGLGGTKGWPNTGRQRSSYTPQSHTHCSFRPALLLGHPWSRHNWMYVQGRGGRQRTPSSHQVWPSWSGKEKRGYRACSFPLGRLRQRWWEKRSPWGRLEGRQAGGPCQTIPARATALLYRLVMFQQACLSQTLDRQSSGWGPSCLLSLLCDQPSEPRKWSIQRSLPFKPSQKSNSLLFSKATSPALRTYWWLHTHHFLLCPPQCCKVGTAIVGIFQMGRRRLRGSVTFQGQKMGTQIPEFTRKCTHNQLVCAPPTCMLAHTSMGRLAVWCTCPPFLSQDGSPSPPIELVQDKGGRPWEGTDLALQGDRWAWMRVLQGERRKHM